MEHEISNNVGDITNLLSEAVYTHATLYTHEDETLKASVVEEDNETGKMIILVENQEWQIIVKGGWEK